MTAPTTALRGRTRTRVAAGAPPKVLRRETHQPDYVILVAVIAMSAIGILMVFSSSAMKEFTRDGDVFGAVAPQVAWGVAGLLAMLAMMRIDYRRLRLVSIPIYAIAVVLLMLVFVPSLGQVVGGSARWLKIGPLPAVHPAEFAKLALVIYLAHWLAKRGTGVGGLLGGTLPFLVIFLPIVALVLKEPDLGTSMVLATTGLTMFVLAGGNLVHFAVLVAGGIVGIVMFALRGTSSSGSAPGSTPGRTRPGSASTRSRACSRSARVACSGSVSGRVAAPAGCSCRMPATTSSSR